MVSAVRVGGERLYRAARRGEEVERQARTVTVHNLDVASFDASAWEAVLDVRCSRGTYVRTLAADIGEALGCGAHLKALRRTSIGSLGEDDAVTVAQLDAMDPDARRAAVLPMSAALRDFDSVTVGGEELEAVTHGRSLGDPGPEGGEGPPVAVLDPDGRLVAVYRRQGAGLRPVAVLL
jgi:tRNA pseudouridine55 synthase